MMEQIFVWRLSDIIAIILIVAMAAIMALMYVRLMIGNTIRWFKKKLSLPKVDDNIKLDASIVQYTPMQMEKQNHKQTISDQQKYKEALGLD